MRRAPLVALFVDNHAQLDGAVRNCAGCGRFLTPMKECYMCYIACWMLLDKMHLRYRPGILWSLFSILSFLRKCELREFTICIIGYWGTHRLPPQLEAPCMVACCSYIFNKHIDQVKSSCGSVRDITVSSNSFSICRQERVAPT